MHTVDVGDTMSGLCVKYSTSAAAIKKLNKMTTNEIITRQTILVPKPENWDASKDKSHLPDSVLIALRKRRLTTSLARKERIEPDQAVVYL